MIYKNFSQINIIILTSIFITLFYNLTFFQYTHEIYPTSLKNIFFMLSVAVVLCTFIAFLLTLISSKWTTKFFIIVIFFISSLTAYFMDNYNSIIDANMIRNVVQTNFNESFDLLTPKLLLYFIFLGLLPSVVIYKIKIEYKNLKYEIVKKIKYLLIFLSIIILNLLLFNKYYTSFFREHKPLRSYTNPTYWLYSINQYIKLTYTNKKIVLKKIGNDAFIKEKKSQKKKLVILVVGEAARADHFSLNGYKRDTNPNLGKTDIANFTNCYSCGTSTGVSVPCMFSMFSKKDFSYKKGIHYENILDILKKTKKVDILWRDNNSDSKGVALRVKYQNFKTPKNNPICDKNGCYDMGMLTNLDQFIDSNKSKNKLIILHQMGNHGPAYYKRYPKEFEKFKPICKTNQLENCTKNKIINSYDNAILYTDYFLSQTINLLKKYKNSYDCIFIYLSDHGESLGEHGIYLHGLPYFMAPTAQKHIPMIIKFFNKEFKTKKIDTKVSQDNLFHTLLGLFDVHTKVYKKELDLKYLLR